MNNFSQLLDEDPAGNYMLKVIHWRCTWNVWPEWNYFWHPNIFMGNFQHIHYQALLRWGIFIWQHFLDERPSGKLHAQSHIYIDAVHWMCDQNEIIFDIQIFLWVIFNTFTIKLCWDGEFLYGSIFLNFHRNEEELR